MKKTNNEFDKSNYDALILSSFRLFPVHTVDRIMCDETLIKAMTINEELLALGYVLSPKSVIMLAKSPVISAGTFLEYFKSCIGDVKTPPMYPNFPTQVMTMPEATYRFHQMLHYMSTYGVELFTGNSVSKGWLPEVETTEKTKSDDNLLAAKVIELIEYDDKYLIPYQRILGKTERVDDKECMILESCVRNLELNRLTSIDVKFKENLIPIFTTIWRMQIPVAIQLKHMHAICQHTGDVFKCLMHIISEMDYHLHTSQKRLAVKLLESYPFEDFSANLIRSGKERENVLRVLRYTDFNEYARNKQFIEAVRALRNKELKSWESEVKALVRAKDPKALTMYASRPGIMLRQLTFLLRNGYSDEDIQSALGERASMLKTQTIVSLINHFGRIINSDDIATVEDDDKRRSEAISMYNMLIYILEQNFHAKAIELKGKKIYVDETGYNFDQSIVDTSKSTEGGYIRSGIAYKIPDNVKRVRFFVYWNDEQRVDVDLHTSLISNQVYVNGKCSCLDIGWDAKYVDDYVAFSGDITHSDAAEYIDIDLDKAASKISRVNSTIKLYSGYPAFKDIDVCFVGAMAVNRIGEDVKLYDPKNCFFTHYLTGNYDIIHYGYIDIKTRSIIFIGKPIDKTYTTDEVVSPFNLNMYISLLFKACDITRVYDPEEADNILIMGKPSKDNEVSLIDNNFFMDA